MESTDDAQQKCDDNATLHALLAAAVDSPTVKRKRRSTDA
jgi:hypothetical protein